MSSWSGELCSTQKKAYISYRPADIHCSCRLTSSATISSSISLTWPVPNRGEEAGGLIRSHDSTNEELLLMSLVVVTAFSSEPEALEEGEAALRDTNTTSYFR